MTDQKLEFANMLKKRIDRLDSEIHLLMDLCPPVRSSNRLRKGMRGLVQEIKDGKLIRKRPGLADREIDLSNEDVRALTDIRTAEREALQQVLDELE